MSDPSVLLVSDRPVRAARLASAIGLARPCRVVEPDQPLPPQTPLGFLIDLVDGLPDTAWGEALTRTVRLSAAPCVYMARQGQNAESPEVTSFGAPTLVRVAQRAVGVVPLIVRLVDEAASPAAGAVRLARRVTTATQLVTGIFEAALAGRAPKASAVEEGTDIVLAAVAEAGIRAWLDRLREHHIGVYEHSLSVAGFSAAFAVELGLGRHDRHRLAKAALLHDIGKAHIPTAILDKPGPLTPEEMRVMREHPAIGAALLAQDGGYDETVLDVVRHHHERLDGSGYPDGLAGSDVGDLARLVAICDVHSALTERRAYRPAMSAKDARRVMRGMAGQLDEDLLRAYDPVILRSAPSDRETRFEPALRENTFS